jgi:cytochrome c
MMNLRSKLGKTVGGLVVATVGLAGSALAQDAIDPSTLEPGANFKLYDVGAPMRQVPTLVTGQTPGIFTMVSRIDFTDEGEDFGGLKDNFVAHVEGYLNIPADGTYEFRVESDDGSLLFINGAQVVNNDGNHGRVPVDGKVELKTGFHPFQIRYFEAAGSAYLGFLWRPPGENSFRFVEGGTMMVVKGQVRTVAPGKKRIVDQQMASRPGDGTPQVAVHPSFDLSQARPSWFQPKVGGIDWLSDGRMVVCTWDPDGSVYILEGVGKGDPEAITVKRFASGLAEPLGLTVVKDRIYVLQKQELTEVADTDGDGVADQYRAVASGWSVSPNFHEFAFGLVYRDGHFYFNLATAIDPGGASTQPQLPDRGTVVKANAETGAIEFIARGLRTPNGIGFGVDNEIFLTDNQGDYLPSNKLMHLKPGAFYGNRSVLGDAVKDVKDMPPAVWLVQNEIGNSPGNVVPLNEGPYKGQMLVCDVTHGGVKRIFLEKIDGEYQGTAFEWIQGLEAGVNRIAWGPDGALYAGGIGSAGNWGQEGKKHYGLQRLKYNGKETFEMLAVRARTNGMEIEFTRPLAAGLGWDPGDYAVSTFQQIPTPAYGGPKANEKRVRVASASVSEDRRKVFLEIPNLKPDHVVYIHLIGDFFTEDGQQLWTTMTWYTLNRIPQNREGQPKPLPSGVALHNTLSEQEKADGWKLLFDGQTLNGWKRFNSPEPVRNWKVEDGRLIRFDGGGDIMTVEEYTNFELTLDWRISPGGNSGIFYGVKEGSQFRYPWETGPEMQVLDNAIHGDGKNASTSAGANYALWAPPKDVTRPVGTFNTARLVKRGDRVEHWLNGVKLFEFDWGGEEWLARVKASKFNEMPNYGKFKTGHIALQDHGDLVHYRNIKIRPLP